MADSVKIEIEGVKKILQNIEKMRTSTLMMAEDLTQERGDTAAKDAKDFLKSAGVKRRSGRYFRGLKSKYNEETLTATVGSFYRRRVSRIAHLLEYGHRTKSGTMTRKFPHMKPSFNKNIQPYFRDMIRAVKYGIRSAKV